MRAGMGPQLLFKLRGQQIEQFGSASDEECGGVRGAKDNRVARGAPTTLQPRFLLDARRFAGCCRYSARKGLSRCRELLASHEVQFCVASGIGAVLVQDSLLGCGNVSMPGAAFPTFLGP